MPTSKIYYERKERGVCVMCGKMPPHARENSVLCADCAAMSMALNKMRAAKYKSEGRCVKCGAPAYKNKTLCQKCLVKLSDYNKIYYQRKKVNSV